MSKTLVVMIHGLTGGGGTWVNDENGASFSELLQADSKISDQIDVIELTTLKNCQPYSKCFEEFICRFN